MDIIKKHSRSNYDLQVDIGRKIFLEYDQELILKKYGLEADERWIYLTYLNTPFRISRESGLIEELRHGTWEECRRYNTVMTIYDLLCYHKGPVPPQLAHQWCAIGHFIVTGITDAGAYAGTYAAHFDHNLDALKAACIRLGGVPQAPMAGADVTYKIPVTPYLPVVLQFWESDDEFPPKFLLLWDKNAKEFLHFETTFYLQGDLLERLMQK